MMMMMMTTRRTMPRGPDLNLNTAPLPCNGSVMEFLKQAMLQQEIAFRHQVRELHRLYWTQRNLMSELRRRTMPNSKYVASPQIGLLSLDSPRPFNLDHLPAADDDDYIRTCCWQDENKTSGPFFAVELLGSALLPGDVTNSCKASSDRNDYEQQEKTTHPHAGELRGFSGACSIDRSAQKNQSISSKLILIDLNETLDDESSDAAWHNPLSAIASSSSMNSTVVQCGASSNSHATTQQFTPFWRESSNQCPEGTPVGSSHLASEYTRESNTINSFHGFQDSQMSAALASTTHDLETTTEDFTYQKQPGPVNLAHDSVLETLPDIQRKPTSESSGDIVCRVQINVNGIVVPSVSGSFAMDSKDADVHGDSRKQAPPLTPSDDIEGGGTNLHASVGSTNLPPTVSRGSEDKKKHNHEGSEEDTLSSHTIGRGVEHRETCSKEVPFVMSKYELVVSVNNDSSSGDQCMQKHTVPFIAEESGMTRTELPVSESYPNKQSPVAEVFDRCSVQIGSCNIGKTKCLDHAENDSFIFTAAEALVFISLRKPECLADQLLSGFGCIELDADHESEEPQCSFDSFESLTLKLPESKIDEYPPTPVIPAEKAKGNNACGVKLRRGRGLRDFQKDILPGLVSLSRHEICEDLHTIENALRKCRTKSSVNWLTPVRNRRSRRLLSTNNRC